MVSQVVMLPKQFSLPPKMNFIHTKVLLWILPTIFWNPTYPSAWQQQISQPSVYTSSQNVKEERAIIITFTVGQLRPTTQPESNAADGRVSFKKT